jgi:glycosyltransferase involved in cell wall biosynthesis
MKKRKKVVMLVSEDPTTDTRVRREAVSAANTFEVTVIGIDYTHGPPRPDLEIDGYRIVYVRKRPLPIVSCLRRLDGRSFSIRERLFLFLCALLLPIIGIPLLIVLPFLVIGRALFPVFPRLRRIYHVPGFRWIFFLWTLKNIFQFTDALVSGFEALGIDADVIHANDLDTLLAGALIKARHAPRLVYDAHELWPVQDPFAPWYHVRFFRWFEKKLIKNADTVFTVSEPLAHIMKEWYGSANVSLLPNALPYRKGIKVKDGGIGRLGGDRVKFLYHGGFLPGRGIETLIHIWSQIDTSKAVLFLRGADCPYKTELKKIARQVVKGDGVYFLDAVPLDDVVPAAMEADIGVIPYEPVCLNNEFSCPNKLSEYMQAGLLLLVNRRLVNVEKIVTKYKCGLAYDPDDDAQTLAVISELISNSRLRNRLRINARRAARDQYNWASFEDVLLDAYR